MPLPLGPTPRPAFVTGILAIQQGVTARPHTTPLHQEAVSPACPVGVAGENQPAESELHPLFCLFRAVVVVEVPATGAAEASTTSTFIMRPPTGCGRGRSHPRFGDGFSSFFMLWGPGSSAICGVHLNKCCFSLE